MNLFSKTVLSSYTNWIIVLVDWTMNLLLLVPREYFEITMYQYKRYYIPTSIGHIL